jgi:hypothetical protein
MEDIYRGMVGEHGSYWRPVTLKQAQKFLRKRKAKGNITLTP